MIARRLGSALAAAVVVGVLAPGAAAADDRVLCRFDSGELDEVSGIAASQQHPDIIWATNDSGGGPYLYAVSTSTCRVRATLRLLDTPARDHEAVAVGRDAEGRDVIWIGDIGDNIDGWPYARIHKVREPEVLRDMDVPVTTYRYTYPGGPRDAEALLAAPDREQLWVISKSAGGGRMYALPSPMSPALEPMRATAVGSARALVTDAAMDPDGSRYVVRDYFSAEIFAGQPPGAAEVRFGLPLQPQGEAISFTSDGAALLVASEGSGELIQVDIPGESGGIADALPRIAGFDISRYARPIALVVGAIVALAVVGRARRRHRQRR